MGKSKKKESGGSKTKQPACACDHPYNCSCGNRPPRPSRGHKWDPETQQWGGKGHKQKGASGQTASAAQAAKTTEVGKTTVAQWQRLPSQLLKEFCQRQKRRPPKLKDVGAVGKHKYRCIVPDQKNPDKDLFFVPQKPVANQEQSKEEACLLALLALTPALPHERKLPEPYRTTWLNAIQAVKAQSSKSSAKSSAKNNKRQDVPAQKTSDGQSAKQPDSVSGDTAPSNSSGAQASTSLTMATTYASLAEKKRQQQEKKRLRNARIRKHEAIRMANQRHPVFLSASIRRTIEQLLRGDTTVEIHSDDEDEDDDEQAEERKEEEDSRSDIQMYVEERLHTEGFTRRHVRKAFQQLPASAHDASENEWDTVYEKCLQWLLVHIDEEHLPEGFDPRGRTLDVVTSYKTGDQSTQPSQGTNGAVPSSNGTASNVLVEFATKYGMTVAEAAVISAGTAHSDSQLQESLWNTVSSLSGYNKTSSASAVDAPVIDEIKEKWNEELEALQAIYGSDLVLNNDPDGATVRIDLPMEDNFVLIVTVQIGKYPYSLPRQVLIQNSSRWQSNQGLAAHVDMLREACQLPLGEPMLFELHGIAQASIHKIIEGGLAPIKLTGDSRRNNSQPHSTAGEGRPARKDSSGQQRAARQTTSTSVKPAKRRFRPRERTAFWSLSPRQIPPAVPFPSVPKTIKDARSALPATKARQEFLDALKRSETTGRVLLVQGETGCGKSTQLPQIILESFPDSAKIVVAQPRRLAATGVAGRVAEERGESEPGKASVGYVIRGDTALCKQSRLVFCTTGVLLRQFQNEGALDCLTHIVVDEVHERQLDTDILLGLLKGALKQHKHLKVILMSATLDAERFAAYWGPRTPKMFIPGRTFPVTDYFLEDVLTLTGYIPPKKHKGRRQYGAQRPRKSSPWDDSEFSDGYNSEDDDRDGGIADGDDADNDDNPASDLVQRRNVDELVQRVNEADVDLDMLGSLVSKLVRTKATKGGSILVFLPGTLEINRAIDAIRHHTKNQQVWLLPLHGSLQPREQHLVFRPAPAGSAKVICSTNVAETSITIPDCTVVIDAAKEKQSSYDPGNRMPLLLEQFASKASLKQRRGRAGRVREGVCYKLISAKTHASLPDHSEPEIRRCALDQTLLSLLYLGVETGIGSFTSTLLDPPSKESMSAAADSLVAVGAVRRVNEAGGELSLTPLGVHLAGIPAPPTVGKLLVMGSILGCRTAALAMAAGISMGRSPFLRIDAPRVRRGGQLSMEDEKRQRVLDERKKLFDSVGNSDHALLAALFTKWKATGTGGGRRKRLCETYGLSFPGMRDMNQAVNQLDASLSAAGYVQSNEADANQTSWRIIRSCAVSAMSPSQLVKVRRPATTYEETRGGAKERDSEARALKFFIRKRDDGSSPTAGDVDGRDDKYSREERVFVHPSSFNFSTGNYSCPWLVYHSLVRTSNPFLRDVTECSAYSLLLFGGSLDVQASKGVICVADWAELSASARIGALIGGLRTKVDELLERKVDDPGMDLADSTVMHLITKLIRTDGLGS